ncbi:Putative anti-sigma factor antagonist [Jannaschia seosinensis]|uniref:Putative anti-sigma factor antagonist n=1 Tax=Jannaschia seosinensis TaxID=313367 RepID=A0A0M7B7I2_9RHOB|nr:STAS domain-containing protein [Jannaschia seosinensis]CUH33844.1 Putative anti-sigma factor antagonist [Jannaschia seosinensis]
MNISCDTRGGLMILVVNEPRIDAAGAVDFKDRFRTLVAGFDGRVIIDMAQVEFLDSSGLGALVAVMKMLGGNRRLELARCGEVVRKVLTLTRMDRVFVLHDSLEDADRAAA